MSLMQIISIDGQKSEVDTCLELELWDRLSSLLGSSCHVDFMRIDPMTFENYGDMETYLNESINTMCSLCVVIPGKDVISLEKLSSWFKVCSEAKPYIIYSMKKDFEEMYFSKKRFLELGEMVWLHDEKSLVSFCRRYSNLVDSFFSRKNNLFNSVPKDFFNGVESIVEQFKK